MRIVPKKCKIQFRLKANRAELIVSACIVITYYMQRSMLLFDVFFYRQISIVIPKSCEYVKHRTTSSQYVIDAVYCIEQSGSIVDLMEDAQHEKDVTINELMLGIERARRRGWMLCNNTDNGLYENDKFANALAGIVSKEDTPDSTKIARIQLATQPRSRLIEHQLALVQACITCYDTVICELELLKICRIMRELLAYEIIYWQNYTYCALLNLRMCIHKQQVHGH